MTRRRAECVCTALRNREYYGGNQCCRKSYKILRTLICEGNYSLKKVWEKHSNCSISCEGNSIYFDKFKTCYSGYSTACRPRKMYNLMCQSGTKIEDALVYNAVPPSTSQEASTQECDKRRSCLIGVLSDRTLVRYHVETGKVLETVYLSSRYNFKEMAWNHPHESIVLRSTHSRMTAMARQAGITTSLVMVLAVFYVLPLQFLGMMEVSKTIFGKDVTDSRISQGMLIVMHQTGHVKIYSFDRIVEECLQFEAPLYEKIKSIGDVCGRQPFGLPMNIKLEDCPPVLFYVRCADHSVEVGGFPWHYMISPYGQQGVFQVYSMETKEIAVNGKIENLDSSSIEPDRAVFHADESGRILHIGADIIKILQLKPNENGFCKIENAAEISISQNPVRMSSPTTTSSGRSVKTRISLDELRLSDCPQVAIHEVDYENDLDLLFVSVVHQDLDKPQGNLIFCDNLTGKVIREFQLEEPWKEYYEHLVCVDLDTVIQVIKPSQGKFFCSVYRLSGPEDENLAATGKKKKHRGKNSATASHSTPRRRSSRRRR